MRYLLYQQRARYNKNNSPPTIVAKTRRLNGIRNVLDEHIRMESEHLRTKVTKNGGTGYVTEGPYRKYFYVFLCTENGSRYYKTYFYIRDNRDNFVEIV
jgi:hypothetical protein